MSEHVEYLAGSEEEPLHWFGRGCSRMAARREAASMVAEPWWKYTVRARWMRPATGADCDHSPDDHPDSPCWHIDDGWMWECDPGDPGAIPVWRVERYCGPSWWLSSRLRRVVVRWRMRRRVARFKRERAHTR